MKKLQFILFSGLFLLILALPAAWLLLTPDRSFSENENRYLEQTPAPEKQTVLSGSYQSELETWMADQFPGRDALMALGTAVKKTAGYRDIGGAYLGRDGCSMEMHLPEDFDHEKYLRNLGYLANAARQAGIPAKALLIPCAASVLTECLPAGARSYDAAAAYEEARAAQPDLELPDVTAALAARPELQRYYRTDHHWTAAGAKLAYDCLMGGNGAYAGTPERFCDDFRGTTYSKTLDLFAKPDTVELFPVADTVRVTADGEEIPLYDRTAAGRKDKYTVYLGGNHGLVTITGGCENGKTLLVLKDSFANCLAPLLTADYERVILVDLRYYPGSVRALLQTESVDELLFVYEMSNLASGSDFVKLLL